MLRTCFDEDLGIDMLGDTTIRRRRTLKTSARVTNGAENKKEVGPGTHEKGQRNVLATFMSVERGECKGMRRFLDDAFSRHGQWEQQQKEPSRAILGASQNNTHTHTNH